jgi:hypothetical protein
LTSLLPAVILDTRGRVSKTKLIGGKEHGRYRQG